MPLATCGSTWASTSSFPISKLGILWSWGQGWDVETLRRWGLWRSSRVCLKHPIRLVVSLYLFTSHPVIALIQNHERSSVRLISMWGDTRRARKSPKPLQSYLRLKTELSLTQRTIRPMRTPLHGDGSRRVMILMIIFFEDPNPQGARCNCRCARGEIRKRSVRNCYFKNLYSESADKAAPVSALLAFFGTLVNIVEIFSLSIGLFKLWKATMYITLVYFVI